MKLRPTNTKTQLCFCALEQSHYPDLEIDHPVAGNDTTTLPIVGYHICYFSQFLAFGIAWLIALVTEYVVFRKKCIRILIYEAFPHLPVHFFALLLAGIIQSWLTFRTL